MKKLIIHFGIHRTGTTALQRTLRFNQSHLKKQGVLYPDLGYKGDHAKVAWGLIKNKHGSHTITPEWLISAIEKETNSDIHTIILSHEDFAQVGEYTWLKTLDNVYDLEIVVYLRRQDIWLESWYNQHIKWPWDKKFSSCTPEFFLENLADFHWIDFDFLLNKISENVDHHKLYINLLDPLGIHNTTTDFLDRLNVQYSIPADAKEANASISTAKLDILRRIDLMGLTNTQKEKILNVLKKLDVQEDNGSKAIFDEKQINVILNHFQESNKKVAMKFFNRENLFSEKVEKNGQPAFVVDWKAYRVYIPRMLKMLANSNN